MRNIHVLSLAIVALLSSALTLTLYKLAGFDRSGVTLQESSLDNVDRKALAELSKDQKLSQAVLLPNFVKAAAKTRAAVVHIISTQNARRSRSEGMPDVFRDFFGDEFDYNYRNPRGGQPAQSSGSGVIISDDGYIVTNYHVIENASVIEVVLNDQKTYEAEIVGEAPSTDLAVIKIKEKKLPFMVLGNSDGVEIGEWVMAVGNPFNLESTVTAGIVSAKGRSLNILRRNSRTPIEAFIQTDAAVNPGNSGGALINLRGELIGINTAIATPTGTFAGYSFAVPVNIVKKVVKDLIEYGSIQRGYLGVTIQDVNGKFAKLKGLKISEGVYVEGVEKNSAADAAGIKPEDVIIGIDGKEIKNTPELLEEIAKRSPGDAVKVKIHRKGSERTVSVTLKNSQGNEEIITRSNRRTFDELGAELSELTEEQKKEYKLQGGIQVVRLMRGKLKDNTNMREGFIITKVGGRTVRNLEEFAAQIEANRKDGIFISGRYPEEADEYYYAFGM